MRRGQSLIELVFALGIGVGMLGIASGSLFLVLRSSDLAQQNQTASALASSVLDNVSVLAGSNWRNIYDLNKGSQNHYRVATSTTQLYIQSGDQQITADTTNYTVYFYVGNVSRDASGNIESVYNSSNDDPSTQKITALAGWQIADAPASISSSIYLTRRDNKVFRQTDWSGGSGQEGPITVLNSKFTSQLNVDYSTLTGSISPITNNLVNVYVSDLDNDRIQKFDGNGAFLLKWGTQGTGNGQFQKPYGVAIDSLNNVYVVDKDNHRIQKFDSNGNFILKWGSQGSGDGQFGHPQGIAIDSASNIYVVDLDRDRIQKFDSSGNFLLKWGSNGKGDGQFNKPQDVAVDSSNNVYVTDQDNNRVQKFNSSGNFLLKWGTNGIGNGQFKKPFGIGVDNSNNVYVADRDNDRVQKFDSAGNFLLKWGTSGIGDGQFQKPQGVTADQNNEIYVADSNNHRVQKFNSGGSFLLKWGSQGSGNGQFNHPRGLEYIPASCDGNCILTSSIFDTASASQNPVLSGWITGNSFPVGTSEHTSVVYNGYVYLIGGQGGTGREVYYAPINSNGSVGTWNATTPLPAMRQAPASVVANGYVYVIGGYSGNYESTVYYAPLNANGTIGAWNTTTALPGPRYRASADIYNGYIYIIGGRSSGVTYQSTVYYAPLNANGTIGAWNTANALPATRSGHSSGVANGYLYAIGGYNGSYQSTVYYAQLNADGSLGTWSTNANSLLENRSFHRSTVINGYIYVIAGSGNGGAQLLTVNYAQLNGDGSAGVWGSSALPAGRQSPSVLVENSRVYILGGWNNGETATVYYSAPILTAGGAVLNNIMWQGNQPSGTSVKFQIASSNSSSGPWNYLGSDGSSATYYSPAGPNIQVKVKSADHNNKRYFRYKIFFDVSGATVPRVDDIILNWSR